MTYFKIMVFVIVFVQIVNKSVITNSIAGQFGLTMTDFYGQLLLSRYYLLYFDRFELRNFNLHFAKKGLVLYFVRKLIVASKV